MGPRWITWIWKERGITITSAATSVEWDGHPINLIDTPERRLHRRSWKNLRVLDGAVLVLAFCWRCSESVNDCGPTNETLQGSRLAFINKMTDIVGTLTEW